MKLALKRPVQILIFGAGGTGGYVIPHLYRIAFASDRKCRITELFLFAGCLLKRVFHHQENTNMTKVYLRALNMLI